MRRALLAAVVALAAASVATYGLYRSGVVRFNEPSHDDYPVRGIDVSAHQERIAWDEAIATGIDFAYIKSSEGARIRDRRFARNWRLARPIARGAYHFFHFCTDGESQAANFLNAAPPPHDLPPAIDVEFSGNCTGWSSIEDIRAELATFVSLVEDAHRRPPVIYVNRRSYDRIVRGHFDGYPLWVREGLGSPPAGFYEDWLIWQYAGNGRMNGVRGLVDLNVFNGSRSAFDELARAR